MRTLLFALIISLAPSASAQKSYLSAGIGYGFSIGGITNVTRMPYTYNSAGATLGRGMTYGFNIGHMVNNSAGIDLGIWYVAGSTYEAYHVDSANFEVPLRMHGNTLRILPALKLMWGQKHKPYIKLGIVLGIATEAQYENEYYINNTCVISPYTITHKFSGGSSFGWAGTFGINFSDAEKISFFIEANVFRQQYEPVKEAVEACGRTTLTYQLVDKPNPNNPDEKQQYAFPFSSIGINAGIKFLLGAKTKDAAPPAEVK